MRPFRDRDYVQTVEGLFFTVVGNIHPKHRAFAYLKYMPSPHGKWGRRGEFFVRAMPYYTIPSLIETIDILKLRYPHYMLKCPVFNIEMSSIPMEYVKAHYLPEVKLSELSRSFDADALQSKAMELVEALSKESNVPKGFFGLTGSILIDIHRAEFSDIDLVVYGRENSLRVKEALKTLYKDERSGFKRFDGRMLKEWCERESKLFPLTYDEAMEIYARKWGRGVFNGTMFSVHPVKMEGEVDEAYGDKVYMPKGFIEARAKVVEDSESMFTPSIYKVDNVVVEAGLKVKDIREVASYEGIYCNLAKVGEEVKVRGKLELIVDKKRGEEYYRILVGSLEARGYDYIKLSKSKGS